MAYIINKSDTSKPAVNIPDGQADIANFSVPILGKSTAPYGQLHAQTIIHMLENFAGPTEPTSPIEGQLWFNNDIGTLNVYRTDGQGNTLELVHFAQGTNNIGTSGTPIGTLYGTATSAQYADLAERYEADEAMEPGTIVEIGGEKQITASKEKASMRVFGVISTSPGLMLNSNAGSDDTHPYVALSGQVPVRVIGKVKKGDRLIASDEKGVAQAASTYGLNIFSVIGRSLEDKSDDGEGTVLAAVGAK